MDDKSLSSQVAWSSCCIQNFKTFISVVWGIQSPNFAEKILHRDWLIQGSDDEQVLWGLHFKIIIQVLECYFACSTRLTFFFFKYRWQLHWWLKRWKSGNTWTMFVCHWLLHGTRVAIAAHNYCQCWSERKKAFNSFRVLESDYCKSFWGQKKYPTFKSQGLNSTWDGCWIA